jgi:hypothetical protein
VIGSTCDNGTVGVYQIYYGTTTNTSTNGPTISSTSTWDDGYVIVAPTRRSGRTRANRNLDLDLPWPERGRCFYAREETPSRPHGAVLESKTVRRTTVVTWTRGRTTRDLSLRTLRLLGRELRR